MKKLLFYLFLLCYAPAQSQTCSAAFTCNIIDTTVSFVNLSSLANAYYYWDFGNGNSSDIRDPNHQYLCNGNYLVTLYVRDTISGCSNFVEHWLTVTANSPDICSPFMEDSIYFESSQRMVKFKPTNNSCSSGLVPFYTTFWHLTMNTNTMTLPFGPANFASIGRFGLSSRTNLTIKTTTVNFDKSKNYTPCSANFEYKVISEDATGQTFLFIAMNKNALSYSWAITDPGAGGMAVSYRTGDKVNIRLQDAWYIEYPLASFPYSIRLKIQDANGCADSLWQTVLLRPKAYTTSLNDHKKESLDVSVCPNPVKDKIKLLYDPNQTKLDALNISDALGQIILSRNDPNTFEEIDLQFLKSGLYYLKVQSKVGQKVFKILKE